MRTARLLCLFISVALLTAAVCACAAPKIVIRNNHDFAYDGPVTFKTSLPDGHYSGKGEGVVSKGIARVTAHVIGHSSVVLTKGAAAKSKSMGLILDPSLNCVEIVYDKGYIGRIEFGLSVMYGKDGDSSKAVSEFKPLHMELTPGKGDVLTGSAIIGVYKVDLTLVPYTGGWIDCEAKITKRTGVDDPVYLALVRKVVAFGGNDKVRTNWNGALIDGTDNPTVTDRIASLTKGVDWCSWKAGAMSWAAINQFSAGYTTRDSKGKWIPANHFYTWEKAARKDDGIYLISEIAGANPAQEKARYMGTTSYCPPQVGEPVTLKWRLAMTKSPRPDWEKSQLLVTAGYRNVTQTKDTATVDLGVPYVEFGTSYFPYSTMTENFDYYRTAGLDREGWWPFSPKMWENWKAYKPQMQTDLRIIKAMGFDLVRLHHLELLGKMDRQNCFAFLDFYMGECRKLGLKVFFDTAGSPEWIFSVVGRYKDIVKYVEIENEILIPGIPKGAPERWTGQYNAVKKVAPNTQAFLTSACNQGMFDRLSYLGVPFDRVGFHNYKHGPAYKESIPSVMLGVANQATDMGKPAVLGEFNWKILTAYSPEARSKEVAEIYAKMLEPRALPTVCQFHWQETMSVNPRLTRQGIRHYETINLDRTPKLEAIELMKLIRKYARPDSPMRMLPIEISLNPMGEARSQIVQYTITNNFDHPLDVKMSAECFDQVGCNLIGRSEVTLKPHEKYNGNVSVVYFVDAPPGVYHFFVKAEYKGGVSCGWGTLRRLGAPKFDAPVLADLVDYPQGADVVEKLDYTKPICVAFGKDCPIVEMEMAYQLRNTLQSATGRYVHLCAVTDVPKSFLDTGNLILVGTPASNRLIDMTNSELSDKGTVILQDAGSGCECLCLTGKTLDGVRAAATDFVLRFWNNAKDSTSRISGLEKGAALGDRAAAGDVNLP